MTTLNPQQQQAIEHVGTPLLIVAGAGSGKTMVLTHKVAYLIQELGVPAPHILAITFTNKAAKEMKARIAQLIGDDKKGPFMGTFHAFCADVLHHHFHHLGRSNDYGICDQTDQTRLMKQILKDFNVSEKNYTPSTVLYLIQDMKNDMVSPEQCAKHPQNYRADQVISQAYLEYEKRLAANQLIDFNDMINYTVKLFQQVPEILAYYQERYAFIMVDEYQDTNHSQYLLVKLLASKYQNLTVVGDFDQNIYSWRGANLKNILNFEKDYAQVTTILLEQNYRSTQTILTAANGLIVHNQDRKEKNLWTENTQGDALKYFVAFDERQESQFIIEQIKDLSTEFSYSDMVVLYRTNAQSRVIEDSLVMAQIPYRVVGGLKFFERAEVKDILAYLRLIHNPNDTLSFSRVVNVPTRGIGDTSIGKILAQATQTGKSIAELTQTGELPVTAKCIEGLRHFWGLIAQWRQEMNPDDPDSVAFLIQSIVEKTGYKSMLEQDIKGTDRLENISELMTLAREEAAPLPEFLNKIALATDLDQAEDDYRAVTLMTLHTAKGLEFDVVFMPGMEEGLLPHYKSRLDPQALEEERRLCYVGITRGRKKVILTSAEKRMIFGEIFRNEESRFIREIPPETIETVTKTSPSLLGMGAGHIRSTLSTQRGYQEYPTQTGSYAEGDIVIHNQWGRGLVQRVEGQGPHAILHISFSQGLKKLMAKYAPIEKLA